MKFRHLSLLALALMFSPFAAAADGQALGSTVWITEPVDWVYRPDDLKLAPPTFCFRIDPLPLQ